MTLLFICSGNMHRSPLAEAMLRAALATDGRTDVSVMSAGTIAAHGLPAVPEAADLARADGLDLSPHRSRPVAAEDVARADLIVLMESQHRKRLAQDHPVALDRCRLLSEWAPRAAGLAPGDDLPDAAMGDLDSFRRSYALIRSCVERLYQQLPPAPQEVYERAVAERFRLRRRGTLGISHADWSVVEQWWRKGIPLWIVLESIDDLFRRKEAKGGGRTARLAFCREDVEERFEAYRRTRSGDGAPPVAFEGSGQKRREDSAGLAEARLIEAVSRARAEGRHQVAEILQEALTGLSALRDAGDEDPAGFQVGLHAIEESLVEGLKLVTAAEHLESMHAAAAERLSEHKDRMKPSAFQATVARLVDAAIREMYGVPSLTHRWSFDRPGSPS